MMKTKKKDQIRALLKSIETGEVDAVAVVNEQKYVQHNPETHEGSEGLAVLFARLSKTNPRVNIVRAFEDGDFVFAHTEYDFKNRNIGFEVFRFEAGKAVEHWDNLQRRQEAANLSGHSMIDGPTEASDHALTENNRLLSRSFVETVLVDGQLGRLSEYINQSDYVEHNPRLSDDLAMLLAELEYDDMGARRTDYRQLHRVLAEGDFVLCVSEGFVEKRHCSFYDLFRIAHGKIVEHWDTTEAVVPKSEWKNDNGKF